MESVAILNHPEWNDYHLLTAELLPRRIVFAIYKGDSWDKIFSPSIQCMASANSLAPLRRRDINNYSNVYLNTQNNYLMQIKSKKLVIIFKNM